MTDAPATGTHHFVPDPRNESVLIDVNGAHFPRAEASVSVFDSGFMLGDGVWEGMRVHRGRIAFLGRHLDRLYRGAKAIAMDIGISREALIDRLYALLAANKMDGDGVHIRLMVTRGIRSTPYQDPRVVISPATIVIIPEHKAPVSETETGLHMKAAFVRAAVMLRLVHAVQDGAVDRPRAAGVEDAGDTAHGVAQAP